MFSTVFSQVLVLFILIFLGVIFAKTKLLKDSDVKAITDLVLYTVTPCVIIKSFVREFDKTLLKNLIITGEKSDGITIGFISAISSNLLNNIPMSVFFSSVLDFSGASTSAVYATVIGSNIGAYLSPIGALAGIMWMHILKEQKVRISFGRFCFYGVLISVPVLLASLFALSFSI